jgi:hypothetical protein
MHLNISDTALLSNSVNNMFRNITVGYHKTDFSLFSNDMLPVEDTKELEQKMIVS